MTNREVQGKDPYYNKWVVVLGKCRMTENESNLITLWREEAQMFKSSLKLKWQT